MSHVHKNLPIKETNPDQGEPIENIRPGDVVWFEPGEKRHGASPSTAMTLLLSRITLMVKS
jgi:quercetin dioxygenase-like cupin family protein